jgi:hypothetical protein
MTSAFSWKNEHYWKNRHLYQLVTLICTRAFVPFRIPGTNASHLSWAEPRPCRNVICPRKLLSSLPSSFSILLFCFLISSHLISSHLISSHLISSHLISYSSQNQRNNNTRFTSHLISSQHSHFITQVNFHNNQFPYKYSTYIHPKFS